MNKIGRLLLLLFAGGGLLYAQLSCGFVVDLSPPYLDVGAGGFYPADGETVSVPSVTFGAHISDDGAGVWYDYTSSLSEWGGSCPSPATYIRWSVNGGAFDTLWGATEATQTFSPGDTITACIHAIDEIHDYGCSCCPNEFDTCWTFYILACDSFWAENTCPDSCGIATSCIDQQMDVVIHPYPGITGTLPADQIQIDVYVNGAFVAGGTADAVGWASLVDSVLTIFPPTGSWNHGDTVSIWLYSLTDCPKLDSFFCGFVVDTVAPELVSHSPALGETLTSAVVTISGSIFDDFVGVAVGSTWVAITTYDSTGTPTNYDTVYGLGDNFSINRTFASGDSVVVCVHAVDNVYLQPLCTCPPNELDSCWWFRVLISEPFGWVVIPIDSNMDGMVVSACDDQNIIIRVYDSHGMLASPVRLWVEGVPYTDADVGIISTALYGTDNETLEVIFDPVAAGLTWSDGMWVHFSLDSAVNVLGFNIVAPVVDSFLVDLSPPFFTGLLPADGTILCASSVTVSAATYDSICAGNVAIDSVHISGVQGGSPVDYWLDPTMLGMPSFSYDITGLANYDSLTICAYATDLCHDYCGPNVGDTCWTFTVLCGEISAELVEPIDTNADGRVISDCDDQRIIWVINHTQPLDTSSISVEVCGAVYTYPDHLTFSNDTLYFTPDPLWSDGDSCGFCLNYVADATGSTLPEPVCGWVLIDLSPPVFEIVAGPVDGDTVYSGDVTGAVSAFDSICGAADIDSITVTTSVSGSSWVFVDSTYSIGGLVDGDVVTVCAYAHDDCADYCGPNYGDTCWSLVAAIGAVSATVVEPVDLNGDSIAISTCDDQRILWVLEHTYDLVPESLVVEVCGSTYVWGDPHLSLSGDTLIWDPSPDLLWGDSAFCTFCVLQAYDVTGAFLAEAVCGSVLIDLSAPVLLSASPPPGGSVFDTVATITAVFEDEICDSYAVDSVWAQASESGATAEADSFPLEISGLVDGDSVTVCAIVHDLCEDYCGPNYDTICWWFEAILGEPNGVVLIPVDLNGDGRTISACTTQVITIGLFDDDGMDPDTTIHLHIDELGADYYNADLELVSGAGGDSLYVTFDPSAHGADWSAFDGEWVHFVLDTAYDIYGFLLVSPVVDSFLVDLSPPVFSGMTPVGTITSASAAISVLATDAVCGDAVADSLVVTSTVSGIDTTIVGALSGVVSGFVDGDVVTVCAYAHDACADYCGPNYGDTCWTFDVSIGAVSAELIEPVDLNGDGRVISDCADQGIRWVISHEYPLVPESLAVEVCGSTYVWGDPELSLVGDTLIWTPSALWSDGDSCGFCLTSAWDNTGGSLESPVCGWVLIDLSPPVFVGETPPDGSVILADSVFVSVFATDSICGDMGTVYDSLVIDNIVSGDHVVLTVFVGDSMSYSLTDLEDGDTVVVCAYAHDACADYCGPNYGSDCWEFYIFLGAVRASVIAPVDLNGDGCIESSCPCQPISWRVWSQHWFDTTNLVVEVDGMTFDWSSGALTLTAEDETTATLTFDPAVAGTCWYENCYVVDFSVVTLIDTLGTDSLPAPIGGSFVVLTEPPAVSFSPAPPETAECIDTLVVDVGVSHPCACSIEEYLGISVDGTLIDAWDSVGTVVLPVTSGDTVCITVWGMVDHDYMCDSLRFGADTCWYIWCPCELVLFGGPDQTSCPGADVILGCDPLVSGTYDSVSVEWYLLGESTPFSTEPNPTVTPETTTVYVVHARAYCASGDVIDAYDTVVVTIDFSAASSPSITQPGDGTVLSAGTNTLTWTASSGTEPVYYAVFINGAVAADSLADTTFEFNINCDETLTITIAAYNQCFYALDGSCNPAVDTTLQSTGAVYAYSETITVIGEPCGAPLAEPIYPPPLIISACPDESVKFVIWDAAGVALRPWTLQIQIGASTYDTSASFITYTAIRPDSGVVTILPPAGSWNDNDTITVSVIYIENEFDVALSSVASLTFYTDQSPPVAQLTYPLPGEAAEDHTPNIVISVGDNLSGVEPDSFVVEIQTTTGRIDTILDASALSWDGSNLSFDCEAAGIIFADGETISVSVLVTCDRVDSLYCGPNCASYSFWFYYPLTYSCDRIPNPFTPNADGANDICQFTFPDLGEKDGTIYIYDLHGVFVRELDVPAGPGAKEAARWDGTDKNGNAVCEGLYIYVIEVDGEIVCEGTVTVAR